MKDILDEEEVGREISRAAFQQFLIWLVLLGGGLGYVSRLLRPFLTYRGFHVEWFLSHLAILFLMIYSLRNYASPKMLANITLWRLILPYALCGILLFASYLIGWLVKHGRLDRLAVGGIQTEFMIWVVLTIFGVAYLLRMR